MEIYKSISIIFQFSAHPLTETISLEFVPFPVLLAANVSPISWKITLTNNVQSESNISKQFLAVINVCKICTTTPAKTKHYLQLFITSLPNRTVDCFLVFVTSANLMDVKSKVILSMARCSKVSKFKCLKDDMPMSTTAFVIPVI